jgi:hypothetical protein
MSGDVRWQLVIEWTTGLDRRSKSRLAVSPPLNYADVSSMATNGH